MIIICIKFASVAKPLIEKKVKPKKISTMLKMIKVIKKLFLFSKMKTCYKRVFDIYISF